MDEEPDGMLTMRQQMTAMLETVIDDLDAPVPVPALAFIAHGLLITAEMRCPDCDELHPNARPLLEMREAFGNLIQPSPIEIDRMRTIRNTLMTFDGENEESEKVVAGLTNITAVFMLLGDNPAGTCHQFTELPPGRWDHDALARRGLALMLEAIEDVPNDWFPVFVQNGERRDHMVSMSVESDGSRHVWNPSLEIMGYKMSMN